jgi:UDP-galactopyranose mutase
MKKKIIILGAGITGLSTAYHLKKDYLIFEKEEKTGGLCRSKKINGFTFDYTGHLLHLHKSYTENLVRKLLKGNLKKIKRNSAICFQGRYIPYPFQANLWALPQKIKNECLKGLSQSPAHPLTRSPASFSDWCLLNYGKGISEYFFFPYNEKIWLHPLKEITTDWVNPFIPQINKKEILEGAEKKLIKNFGYNVYFYYPRKGGIQSLSDVFTEKIKNICLNSKVEKIDWGKKIISVNNEKVGYQYLVSTLPLVELLNRLENPPKEVSLAKNKLSWVSVLCINLGIERHQIPIIHPPKQIFCGGRANYQSPIENYHWIYFPEKEFIFYRVGFYHNFSKEMVPKKNRPYNYASLYIEIAHEPNRILNQKKIISRVKKDLLRCKILNENDKILAINLLPIPYAYVIYDYDRNGALSTINNFLQKNNIFSLGRYGAWKYSFMEESILEGKKVAEQISSV